MRFVASRYPRPTRAYRAYGADREQMALPADRPSVERTPETAEQHDRPPHLETPAAPAAANQSEGSHKQRFFAKLLPLVSRENERLLGLRQQLTHLQAQRRRGTRLQEGRLGWLRALAEDYRVDPAAGTDSLVEALLERVDVIPAGLALAQAANESAWGTSRFAKEGNNLFGTWTYDTDNGIKPQRRAAGKTHLVRRYESLDESVRDYMHNLNSHPAYQPLRKRRAAQRSRGQVLSAVRLAEGLGAYAENGTQYVDRIQSMIRSNNLEQAAQMQVADAG